MCGNSEEDIKKICENQLEAMEEFKSKGIRLLEKKMTRLNKHFAYILCEFPCIKCWQMLKSQHSKKN